MRIGEIWPKLVENTFSTYLSHFLVVLADFGGKTVGLRVGSWVGYGYAQKTQVTRDNHYSPSSCTSLMQLVLESPVSPVIWCFGLTETETG